MWLLAAVDKSDAPNAHNLEKAGRENLERTIKTILSKGVPGGTEPMGPAVRASEEELPLQALAYFHGAHGGMVKGIGGGPAHRQVEVGRGVVTYHSIQIAELMISARSTVIWAQNQQTEPPNETGAEG
jgi:hypothetical protein